MKGPERPVVPPSILGRVDELFDDNPCGNEMNKRQRSYGIPGSYAATDSEKQLSFSRPLKNNGFKEETGTKILLDAIGTSTTLESNKSHAAIRRIPVQHSTAQCHTFI